MQIYLKRALLFLLAVSANSSAWAKATDGSPGLWHYGWVWSWGWPHMVFGGLMMIAFWGGIIFLVVLAVRWFGKNTTDRAALSGRSAMDILGDGHLEGAVRARGNQQKRI